MFTMPLFWAQANTVHTSALRMIGGGLTVCMHTVRVCEFFGYICGNKNLCLLFSFKFGSASK